MLYAKQQNNYLQRALKRQYFATLNNGVPEAIRTPDPFLRREVLCPAELRKHIICKLLPLCLRLCFLQIDVCALSKYLQPCFLRLALILATLLYYHIFLKKSTLYLLCLIIFALKFFVYFLMLIAMFFATVLAIFLDNVLAIF